MAWMILIMKLFSGMAMAWAAREMGASLRLYIPQSTPGKSIINDILKTIVEYLGDFLELDFPIQTSWWRS